MRGKTRSLFVLLCALLACLASASASGSATTDLATFERLLAGYGDSCATEGQTFYCPNCGGIEVTDCLACDGFLNTGESLPKIKSFGRKERVMCWKFMVNACNESAPWT